MIGWIHARDKNLRHFRDIYLKNGIDVISTIPTTVNVLLPQFGLSLVDDLQDVIRKEDMEDRPKIVSAFSVGGFLYGTLLHKARTEEAARRFVETTRLQVCVSLWHDRT